MLKIVHSCLTGALDRNPKIFIIAPDEAEESFSCFILCLTCIFVALKVDDGHPLEARGTFAAIWINQSQISIRIPAGEQRKQFHGWTGLKMLSGF